MGFVAGGFNKTLVLVGILDHDEPFLVCFTR
jgi:hypothetical protein